MKCIVETTSDVMIYVPSFMNIRSGIQVILRLIPRRSDIDIAKGKNLWNMSLRWPQVVRHIHTKFYDDRFRNPTNINNLRGCSVSTTYERNFLSTPMSLPQVGWYCHVFGGVNIEGVFIDQLHTPLGTTSNYSANTNLHNSQITTVPSKPFYSPLCLQQPFPNNDF
jgi:hypothetical protein